MGNIANQMRNSHITVAPFYRPASISQFKYPFLMFLLLTFFSFHANPLFASGKIPDILIDANYPGGNIILERIDGDQIYLHQDLRDTAGWWFYWNFRVRHAEGRQLTFNFTNQNPIGVLGPAVSTDNGRSWNWLGTDSVKGPSFSYQFNLDAGDIRFCFAMPYQQSNLKAFIEQYKNNPALKVTELCKTRKGRSVERIHAGRLDGNPKYRALITARHHACEMMAGYSLEGMLAEVLSDTDDGRWLRQNVELLFIPFMDKDGVEDGDQGKNRKPHDHNRDYLGQSIYPSVAALKTFVPKWSEGRLKVTFDLHCPYIRGQYNDVIYIVCNSDKDIYAQQLRFSLLLQDIHKGDIPYDNKNIMPFGTAWNTRDNEALRKTCRGWASSLEEVKVALTFEIPYAMASGQPVTAQSARQFGRSLAKTLPIYLQQLPDNDKTENQYVYNESVCPTDLFMYNY